MDQLVVHLRLLRRGEVEAQVEVVVLDDLDQGIFERTASRRAAAVCDGLGIVPGRVLGFRIDRDGPTRRLALGLGDVDDVLETDDRKLAVEQFWPFVRRILGGAADPLLQLGHGEIGDRPVVGVILTVDDQ